MSCGLVSCLQPYHPSLSANQHVRIANDSVTVQRHIVQTDDNGYIEVNNALHAPLGGDLLFEEHQSGVAGLVSCLVYDSHRKQLFVTSKRPDDHPRFSSLYYDNPDNVVTLHRWDVLLEGTSLKIRVKSPDSLLNTNPRGPPAARTCVSKPPPSS